MRDNIESGSITPTTIRKKITPDSEKLQSNLISISTTPIIKEYQHQFPTNEILNSNPFVKRFAIDTNNTKTLVNSHITKTNLHDIEKEVFKLALAELDKSDTA